MTDDERRQRLRALPSVDRLATAVARAELDARRAQVLDGAEDEPDLVARARERLRPRLRPVINATGVIVHTNLGRAPLAAEAQAAVARIAAGYSNLELDLEDGGRGSRHAHVEELLADITGAEAGIAVNNCAAAVLLAVAALGGGGRTVVSRGQLVEIGGGFRIPDVLAQAGTTMVEVGTTNRTRVADFEAALADGPAVLLRVHPSNFRTVGFVEDVAIEELCALGAPVIDDVGSGALDPIGDEPPVRRSVRAGTALTCFSGDKLLGGPQAGLLVGTQAAVDACRDHPLARALRIDKLSLAALEATLRMHHDPTSIPVLAMLDADSEDLRRRAESLAEGTGGIVTDGVAKVGGGALPLLELPGPVVVLEASLAAPLRAGDPPVIGRVREDRLVLDPRTLTDAEVAQVVEAVRCARAR